MLVNLRTRTLPCLLLRTRASIAIARISCGNSVCSSICLSVTTRYRLEPTWDRDFWFLPYDTLRVFSILWQNFMPLGEGHLLEREAKIHAPPVKNVILQLLAALAYKRLQIGTNMLLIVTSTNDELLRNVNMDDLEWPRTPKIEGSNINFARFRAVTHISRVNCAKMTEDSPKQPSLKFSALNADFGSPSPNPLSSRKVAQADIKEWYPSKKWLFMRCWLV